jgi:hypothetical protein
LQERSREGRSDQRNVWTASEICVHRPLGS